MTIEEIQEKISEINKTIEDLLKERKLYLCPYCTPNYPRYCPFCNNIGINMELIDNIDNPKGGKNECT